MNMWEANSAILEKGTVLDTYCGEEAVLLCEWNSKTRAFIRRRFEVLPFAMY